MLQSLMPARVAPEPKRCRLGAAAGPTGLANLVHSTPAGRTTMLFIVVLLVVLWFLGVLTKSTLGGLLHILLVVAIVIGLVSFIGRRV